MKNLVVLLTVLISMISCSPEDNKLYGEKRITEIVYSFENVDDLIEVLLEAGCIDNSLHDPYTFDLSYLLGRNIYDRNEIFQQMLDSTYHIPVQIDIQEYVVEDYDITNMNNGPSYVYEFTNKSSHTLGDGTQVIIYHGLSITENSVTYTPN